MRMRTGLAARPRKTVRLSGFRGTDTQAPPRALDTAHASEAVNILCRGGSICKRRGWEQRLPTLPARADGVFAVPYETGNTLLAYAGCAFYLLTDGTWSRVTVRNTVGGLTQGLREGRICAFGEGAYVYLVGAGIYLRYGKFGDAWEIHTVEPYIPTTTVGISSVASADTARASAEYVNLLTSRRKNTLFGDVGGSSWMLDGAVSQTEPMEIRVETYADGVLYERILQNNPAEDGTKLYDSEGNLVGALEPHTGKITLVTDTVPPGDAPNITVTFSGATGVFGGVSTRGRDLVYSASFGVRFGVGGAEDRLFLGGLSNYPNMTVFSERGDFTYFPDQYTATLGSDTTAVTAMLRLSDDVLAVFKEAGSERDSTVYYLSGEYRSFYGEDGNLLRTLPVFAIRAGAMGESPVNAFAAASLAGDSLILSRNGIFGVDTAKNVTVDARHLSERARCVRSLLSERDLSQAAFGVFGDRLYLALGEGCLVTEAHTKHRTEATGELAYEWWYWEPFPARVFFEWEGQLWFGSTDGRLAVCRGDGYADITRERTEAGELGFDFLRGRMLYGKSLDGRIGEGDRITLLSEGIFAMLLEGAESIEGTRIRAGVNHVHGIRDFGAVYADGAPDSPLREGVPYFIVNPDPVTRTFSLAKTEDGPPIDLTGTPTSLCLYLRLSGRTLTVKEVNAERRSFTLAFSEEMPVLAPVNYFQPAEDGSEESTVPLNPIASIARATDVCAEWVTPPLDFGEPGHKKSLRTVCVCGTGSMRVSAESEREVYRGELCLGGDFSFDGLDFSSLAFTGDFSASAVLTPRLRGFGEVRFRICSDTSSPFSVHEIRAEARILNQQKGVI